MNSIVSQQPVMSTGTTNVGDFAELFNEIIGNDGTSEPSSSTDEMLDSFDLGITAAELFPADIFPALLDNNNADCGGPDAAMAELEDPDLGLVDSLFTPEQSDSDSGLGSGGLAAVNNNPTAGPTDAADPDHSCSRTRPFDWRRSRERAPDDCTRLRVEDFVVEGRLAGFLTQTSALQHQQPPQFQLQHQQQHQQQQLTSTTQLFKSEPTDEFLSQHHGSFRLIQPRQLNRQQPELASTNSIVSSAVSPSSPSVQSSVPSPHSFIATTSATGIDYVVGVQSQASTTVAASSGAALVEGDQAKVKRIERMIKNRHSASESRRKRKEYLDGLERRVQSLASENAFLRDENSQLRQRYSELERKLISLEQALGSSASSGIGASSALTGSGRRRPVTAMALLLFLGLNLVGLGVWPLMPGQQQQQPQQPGFHSSPSSSSLFYYSNGPGSEESRALVPYRRASSAGRHLLSASSASSSEPAPEELSALFGRLCPAHNSTESARLAKELDGWAFRYQREAGARELRRLHRQRTRREERLRRRAEATAAAAAAAAAAASKNSVTSEGGSGALQLRLGRDTSLDLLMRALDRREDTMYLVSFRSDHLVFPALAANKTSAPRMTFLMPAVNESSRTSARGTVPLMQIDCEVVNVGLMHLDKWRVPLQFRQDLFGNNRV
ncbi:hypothetical protein BOX15_Mlig031235g1 [Macrostomum lignano]|uniref:BZIP domain-containing protein n=1 Tax=Macrostomum lignano TaxID=282301 RepID=A0A267E6R7_9PLAT|nr:hypothetical protein BOX15_Mlig031235g1 [Macrostomum lignano]